MDEADEPLVFVLRPRAATVIYHVDRPMLSTWDGFKCLVYRYCRLYTYAVRNNSQLYWIPEVLESEMLDDFVLTQVVIVLLNTVLVMVPIEVEPKAVLWLEEYTLDVCNEKKGRLEGGTKHNV